MIFFTTIGLLIASAFLVWLALLGLFQAIFNDIGGNGSWGSAMAGMAVFIVAIYAIFQLWHRFSPFTVVVAP